MTRISSQPVPTTPTFAPDLDDVFPFPKTQRNAPLPLCHGGSPLRPRPPLTPIGAIQITPKPPTTPPPPMTPPTPPTPPVPPITGYTPQFRHMPLRNWIPIGTPTQTPPQLDFTRNALERLAPLKLHRDQT